MLSLVLLLLFNGASPWSHDNNNYGKVAKNFPGAFEYLS
jgi:hypothetical protein